MGKKHGQGGMVSFPPFPLPLHSFFRSRFNFFDELTRKRLLHKAQTRQTEKNQRWD